VPLVLIGGSGTLQNFAGGVIILILKPFKLGDFIDQGYTGTVKEITIFSTMLNTPDKKLVIIPNGPLSDALTNYSTELCEKIGNLE
jgi:small conductance mechanosensitive channel